MVGGDGESRSGPETVTPKPGAGATKGRRGVYATGINAYRQRKEFLVALPAQPSGKGQAVAIRDTIQQVKTALRQGRFPNEAAVSNGVVLRILQALGWPIFDPRTVFPQYPMRAIDGAPRREDFALCRGDGQPLVFIEVKSVGKIEGGEVQLFEYAFHQGIPFAVLTDGQEWRFYLPAAAGAYDERMVYRADLLGQDVEQCCYFLNRYLAKDAVFSGSAQQAAQADYADASRQTTVDAVLPQAWQALLDEADNSLVEVLSDKVRDLCGFDPGLDVCAEFVMQIGQALSERPVTPSPTRQHTPIAESHPELPGNSFALKGQIQTCDSAVDVMVQLFRKLDESDRTFLGRFAARKHGRSRRYIAHSAGELSPNTPWLGERHCQSLPGGWFISTHQNKASITNIVKLACEVADLEFGKDIIINLG